jgi:hypothetical protein
VFPKSHLAREKLKAAMRGNILFSGESPETLEELADAFFSICKNNVSLTDARVGVEVRIVD